MILAHIALRRPPRRPEAPDASDRLWDLERLLDEAFLRDLQPALDEARRARDASSVA